MKSVHFIWSYFQSGLITSFLLGLFCFVSVCCNSEAFAELPVAVESDPGFFMNYEFLPGGEASETKWVTYCCFCTELDPPGKRRLAAFILSRSGFSALDRCKKFYCGKNEAPGAAPTIDDSCEIWEG